MTMHLIRAGTSLLGSEMVRRLASNGFSMLKGGATAATFVLIANEVYEAFVEGDIGETDIAKTLDTRLTQAGINPEEENPEGISLIDFVSDLFSEVTATTGVKVEASTEDVSRAAEVALRELSLALNIPISQTVRAVVAIEALRATGQLKLVHELSDVYDGGVMGHGFKAPILEKTSIRTRMMKGVQ